MTKMSKQFLAVFVFALLVLAPGRAGAEQAFENAGFEKGDFTNWPVHDGWRLAGGVAGHGYSTQTMNHPVLFGDYTAWTAYGRRLAKRYTGKEPKKGEDRLVSIPFKISKPFLTFFFVGDLAGDKNVIGVDVTGDGRPEVRLKAAELKQLNARLARGITLGPERPPLYRSALDLSAHIGKTGRFVAVVKTGTVFNVDDLRLESRPPVWLTLVAARAAGGEGALRLKLEAPFGRDAVARFRVVVLDELGKVLTDVSRKVNVPKDASPEASITFRTNFSEHYRLRITSLTEDGTAAQYIRHRIYLEEKRDGRPFIAIEDGWEMTISADKEGDLPPAGAAWSQASPMRPRYCYGYRFWPFYGKNKYAQVWYRRKVRIPEWLGKGRVYLRLTGGGSSLFAPIVNGKVIDEEVLWQYADYAYDITDALKRGADNEIILRFRNCDKYLRDKNGRLLKAYEKYHWVRYGVMGNLRLEGRPRAHVERVYVDSYWRARKLSARYVIRNRAGAAKKVRLAAAVFSRDGKRVLDLGATEVTVQSGATVTARIEKPWANPIPWSISEPNLLRLQTTLTADGEGETINTRFGFRQIWIKGKRIYVNDWPMRLFESTGTVSGSFEGTKRWRGENGERSMRLGWEAAMAADETGVLTKGVWEDHYPPLVPPTDDYWNSFTKGQLDRVKSLYNHPAIWLWAVGNELGGHGHVRRADMREAFIPRYIRHIKNIMALDPQRPVVSHGEADFFGTSSIWCVHYPYEYSYSYDHPNDAHLLSLHKNIMVWGPHPPYKGDKPVYLGEAFSGGNLGPDWLGAIGSDAVYTRIGILEAWQRWYIERQRAYREDAITGWEPFEIFGYIRNFFPVEIYPQQYNRHFYAGETVERDVRIWNDTDVDRDFVLKWSFGAAESGEVAVPLKKGATTLVKLNLRMPPVKRRTEIPLRLRLEANGKPVSPRWGFWHGTYSVIPRERLNAPAAVMGLDDKELAMLDFFGVKAEPVASVAKTKRRVLFLKDAMLAEDGPQAKAIRDWVAEGATAFVFSSGREDLALPAKLYATKHLNTRAWITAPNDPLTRGLRKDDLTLWGPGDFRVCRFSFLKPTSGAFRVLAEAGDNSGLRLTPLLVLAHGKGRFILSSLLLAEKYKVEPVVGLLLAGVFRSHAALAGKPKRVGTLLSDRLTRLLAAEGWAVDDLAQQTKPALDDYDILWIDTELAEVDVAALKRFAEAGGTLILSRLTPDVIDRFRPIVGGKLRLLNAPQGRAYGGELIKVGAPALLDGLSNFDLWWKRGVYGRGGPGMKITARPAEYVIDPHGADLVAWTEPVALAEMKLGRGVAILDQVRWEEAVEREGRSKRALSTLLFNLGVRHKKKVASAQARFAGVPLKPNYPLANGFVKGLGERPKLLASGKAKLARTPFTFAAPDRFVLLGGTQSYRGLPVKVTIPVKRKAARLHLLHSSARGYIDYDLDKKVFEYRITLKRAGKTWTETVPIRYGQQVDDCLGPHESLQDARQVATSSENGITAYLYTWKNPASDAEVASIEMVSTDAKVLPILLAVTAELPAAAQPKASAERRASGLWSVGRKRTALAEKGRVWAYVGPFPCSPIKGVFPKKPFGSFLKEFPPEKEIDFDAIYRGKNREVSWKKYVEDFPKKIPPGYVNAVDRMKLMEFAHNETDTVNYTAYFFTKVYSPKRQRVIMAFGSDDSSRVFLNGKLVHQVWMQRGTFLGQDCKVVVLNKGWNTVLIKLLNTFGDGAYALDFKPYDPKTVEAWKQNPRSLGPVPSLPLVYDAWGVGEPELAGSEETRKGSLSEVLILEANGKKFILDGRTKDGDAVRKEGDVMTVDFTKAKGASVQVPTPSGTGGFKRGTFEVSIKYPKGGASSHLLLVTRNAGGDNPGDVIVELLGGYPSAAFGGAKDKKAKPYEFVRVFVERKVGYKPWLIPLKGALGPDKWHRIRLTWGGADGFVVRIDGKSFWSKPDYKGPAFAPDVGLGIMGDARNRAHGRISFKQLILRDRIAEP